MGANGSVAGPSRLANIAALTKPALGRGQEGARIVQYGSVGQSWYDRILAMLPFDTGVKPRFYDVNKGFEFQNIAGVKLGQNPVPYNPMLSRVVQTGKNATTGAGLTADNKRYPNASWRHEFQQWAQRFPAGPARSGMGRLAYINRYYPQNLPTQITGDPQTGSAVAGVGNAPRSASQKFVQTGGRGMRKPNFNRLTRLGSAISYSSTTETLGGSIFNEGPLGQGGVTGG